MLEQRVGELFARSCALSSCHSGPTPQMGLDLRRDRFESSTVGRPALSRPDLQLVHPGAPDRSYLVMKVEGREGLVGGRMPLGRDPLSPADVALLREWIGAGALAN